jgi:DNA polymerase Ligase (LigD)
MPRFVILEHDHPILHWDFMLECSGTLLAWRLAKQPAVNESIAATPLPDHRTIYLDYEGEVSGGRGRVRRWDRGEYDWIKRIAAELEVRVRGEQVSGRVYLCKESSGDWRLTLISEDEPAGTAPDRSADRRAERPDM